MTANRNILTAVAVGALFATTAWATGIGLEIKWSQPPVEMEPPTEPPTYVGWDEISMDPLPIVADDFLCDDPRPVVDVHWWGSYPGWIEPIPPTPPQAFLITFWTNVPDPDPDDPVLFSHPGDPIWQVWCEEYDEQFVGYDQDPYTGALDATYQYHQIFRPDQYFYQEPGTIYWISIQAVFPFPPPVDAWGWKTRPHFFEDDAVVDTGDGWLPIMGPDGASWDVAYELSVPEPATGGLLLIGGAVVALRRRRRN